MSETRSSLDVDRRTDAENGTEIRRTVRKFGALNVIAGLLTLFGPAVEGTDDGLVNTGPGLFAGTVAVNPLHSSLHLLFGVLGVAASRDAESSRRYVGLSALLFGALAAVGIGRFGFERGVHEIAGLAVGGWGNFGHAVLSAFSLTTLVESESES